ncbi:MAG: hypothetical protein ACRDWY_08345 [Actinomycetes bacterium]
MPTGDLDDERAWATTLRHLGKPRADFASRLLPHIAPAVAPAESVRENVVLTRAVSGLSVLHTEPLPEELAA